MLLVKLTSIVTANYQQSLLKLMKLFLAKFLFILITNNYVSFQAENVAGFIINYLENLVSFTLSAFFYDVIMDILRAFLCFFF